MKWITQIGIKIDTTAVLLKLKLIDILFLLLNDEKIGK